MITITVKREPYNYEHVGKQEYSVETKIEVQTDADCEQAVIAYVEALKIATFSKQSIKDCLARVAEDIDDII